MRTLLGEPVSTRGTSKVERWRARDRTASHRHVHAYAALVLTGGYEETGSRGRFQVGPGDVLLHRRFDAHFNIFGSKNTTLLNFPVERHFGFGIATVDDPDSIVRLAQVDQQSAVDLLQEEVRPSIAQLRDWPDLLAEDLISDPAIRLDRWALDHGLAAATVSRGFRRAFGVSPVAFRAEVRTQRALAIISQPGTSLASAAAAACFTDQAHMSRAIKGLTGRAPGSWARSNKYKTDEATRL